jgi:FAD:protein FMN transferase
MVNDADRTVNTAKSSMLCAATALIAALVSTSATSGLEGLIAVHQQQYAMGTMFDIVVHHPSEPEARTAVEKAMAEIVYLDQVMSDYKADSDLSQLVREARDHVVTVEPSLYEVISESIGFSRRSGGKFDVTIAPLLRTWKQAQADGRRPSAAAISAARRCVGYENIELVPPRGIRFRSDCLEIDLGGIGKGYAVDRAMAVLTAAGIRHALVNAGSSSIAGIGAPPGSKGWPVVIGGGGPTGTTIVLENSSLSTSIQTFVPFAFDSGGFAHIIDPASAAPAPSRLAISVVAPRATVSDALSTTLLMMSPQDCGGLLAEYSGVSAYWVSANGKVQASYPGRAGAVPGSR